jgi:glycosyltransferase involved in cell wall biosynthesis
MRVLHVTGALDFSAGGPIRFIYDLAEECVRRGWPTDVIGYGQKENFRIPGARVQSFDDRRLFGFHYSADLTRWSRNHVAGYDVVLIHGLWQYPMISVAKECLAHGVPYVVVPHGMLEPWPISGQGRKKWIKKWLGWHMFQGEVIKNAAQVIFTTAREQARALGMFGGVSCRSSVLPYSINTVSLRRVGFETPRENIATFLGRLHPKKNVELLLRAWASADIPPSWHLVVAGPSENNYLQVLEGLAARLRIQGRVKFTGMQGSKERDELLSRSKWFLLPSMQDNFAIAALEAATLGCGLALSTEVYFGDSLHAPNVILPLADEPWRTFFEREMLSESFRMETIRAADRVLEGEFEFSTLVGRWMSAIQSAARVRV